MLIEAILTAVIVLLVLVMIGVPVQVIIGGALILLSGILLLTVVLFVLFFVITGVSLLFYRRASGVLVRFDDSKKWDRAVYLAEGEEYTCLFPAETVFRKRIYREQETTAKTFLLISGSGKRKTAYDRHSLFIIAIGLCFSLLLVIVCRIGIPYLLRFF